MLTVMIVDDERIAREGLRDLVDWESLGLQVGFCAANGEQALDYMSKNQVDIVITDIKMPKMDGLELLHQMSERNFSATTIILSGFNDFRYAQKAIQYGVLHYLLKPVHMEELLSVLERAVADARKAVTAPQSAPEDYARFKTSHKASADAITLRLSSAICAGDIAAAEVCCRELRTLFEEAGYPLPIFKKYAFGCVYILVREVGKHAGMENFDLEDIDLLATLSVAANAREVEAKLCQYASELCTSVQVSQQQQGNRVVSQLITMLQHRYSDQDLNLNAVAESLEITPNYLSALFKRQMGQNFSDYLEQLRMNKACQLLRDTSYKIYEVAEAVGYGDARHFAKVFKSITGQTPKDYRNRRI